MSNNQGGKRTGAGRKPPMGLRDIQRGSGFDLWNFRRLVKKIIFLLNNACKESNVVYFLCMTTKQPTLKQLDLANKNMNKAYSNLQKIEAKYSPAATQLQFDNARAKERQAHAKYWDLVESVTEENPQYDEIIDNGHYEA